MAAAQAAAMMLETMRQLGLKIGMPERGSQRRWCPTRGTAAGERVSEAVDGLAHLRPYSEK
jgi:hypothetical protein